MRIFATLSLSLMLAFPLSLHAEEAAAPPQPSAAEISKALTVKKADHVLGEASAPVTIVEYASLTCTHCAHFHNDILPAIKEKYVDNGKVKVIFRHFPLNEPALKASMLAECSGEKYFTFLKVLFEIQDRWAFDANYMSSLSQIGTVGGMAAQQVDACFADTDLEKNVVLSRKEAQEILGVKSTPTFFVNGTKVEGAVPLEQFSAVIDAALTAQTKP